MFKNISKSASKILGFMIFFVCSYYALVNVSIEALQLGVMGSGLLIGSKTFISAWREIYNKGKNDV